MRNILIVEDNAKDLEKLREALRSQAENWDTMCVSNAAMALKGLEAGQFDVIVSDLSMPVMDGTTLLSIVRQKYPNTVRVGLLDDSELDAPLQAIRVAHQVLDSPCDPNELCQVIERSYALQKILTDENIRKAVGGVESLPALPKIYSELTEALANPNVDFDSIAHIIEKDFSMSAKILQIVNSGFFGLRQPVTLVRNSISMLGMSMIRTLVLSVEVFRPFQGKLGQKGFTLESEQRHALLTANIAKNLATTKTASENAFTAAILHDIGKLILATRIPEIYVPLFEKAHETGVSAHQLEIEGSLVPHEAVGAYLLGLWGIPWSIVEAVAYHHQPARVQHKELETLDMVYVANLLANEVTNTSAPNVDPAIESNTSAPNADPAIESMPWDLEHLAEIGVAECIPEWREMAKQLVEEEDSEAWGL